MTEQATPDSSHYQNLLMAHAPTMLSYWGADLYCRFANRAYEDWFGRSAGSIVGKSLRELLGSEFFAQGERHVRGVLAGQEQTFEWVAADPGGDIRHGLVSYVPYVDSGVVVGFIVQVTDITTLKRAQAALQRNEEYLRELCVLACEGVLVARPDGAYVDVNDACCSLLGYAREELLGKRFEDLLCGSELPRLPQARAQLRSGKRHTERWALQRKDGLVVQVEISAGVLPDGRRVGFLRDMTDHDLVLAAESAMALELELRVLARTKDLEQAALALQSSHAALRASEQRYHTLVDLSPEAIVVHRAGRVAYVNRSAVALFGARGEDDLLDKPIFELIHHECHDFVAHRLERSAENGYSSPVAQVALRKLDGLRIEAEIQGTSIVYGGQAAVLATIRDVTPHRQAEAALRASNATLETALASMSDAVLICDAQGRFINFNDAFASFHRFGSQQACRTALADYPEIIDAFLANGEMATIDQWVISRALAGETATGIEYQLQRKDTGQRWTGSYSFAPIRAPDGAIIGAVVTGRDVTELKLAQASLESAHSDLQRLIAAQDKVQEDERQRIALDLHDDLQQTLAAIRVDVGMVAPLLAVDPASVAPLLTRVDELAAAALVSTRRIVDDLQPQILQDLGLVSALEVLARQIGQRSGLACHVVAADDIGVAGGVSLNPSLTPLLTTSLYRVVQEALNNVVKHAQASAVRIHLASAADGRLVLRIMDDGQGLSEADRKKPQSFGLMGMRERVRALGGALNIHSRPGEGTTIEVVVQTRLGALLSTGMPAPGWHASAGAARSPERLVASPDGL
jgi:PAS domain S-box-containing protein